MGITYEGNGEDYEVSNLKGSCLNCSESLQFAYKGGFSPHYSVDRLGPGGGVLLFNSEDTHGRIFANEENSYKTITSSVVVGAMETGDKLNLKPYLFSEFLNYFMEINPVTALQENIASMLHTTVVPNPFRNETFIRFITDNPGVVQVDIFDISGRWVRSLANSHFEPGNHKIAWDGTDNKGSQLKHGQYLCRVTTERSAETQKLILLR
jgi:hypothetical protein